jgi:hypothetical protein
VAGQLLMGCGYEDVRNYVGSADDWFSSEEAIFARLQEVVQSVCAQKHFAFVKSLELFDSAHKKHAGEFEFLLVHDEAPTGAVSDLALELNDAVKREFGENMTVEVIPKNVVLKAATNSKEDNDYIQSCLKKARVIYPEETRD